MIVKIWTFAWDAHLESENFGRLRQQEPKFQTSLFYPLVSSAPHPKIDFKKVNLFL